MGLTTYENKVSILAELWVEYRGDEGFESFFEYNDIGLPLAYCLNSGMIETNPVVEALVSETYSLLLEMLDVEDDEAFEDLAEIIAYVPELSEEE